MPRPMRLQRSSAVPVPALALASPSSTPCRLALKRRLVSINRNEVSCMPDNKPATCAHAYYIMASRSRRPLLKSTRLVYVIQQVNTASWVSDPRVGDPRVSDLIGDPRVPRYAVPPFVDFAGNVLLSPWNHDVPGD